MSENITHLSSSDAPMQGPIIRPEDALGLAKIQAKYEGAIYCFGVDEDQLREEDAWEEGVTRLREKEGFTYDQIGCAVLGADQAIKEAGGGKAYQDQLLRYRAASDARRQ